MTQTAEFSLEGYHDTLMGGIAFGEVGCVLASGKAPTTPEGWLDALVKHGHTRNPAAAYAHAIAAGFLVPNGEELRLSADVEGHYRLFKQFSG
jgi:hypothetical protein